MKTEKKDMQSEGKRAHKPGGVIKTGR